MNSETKKYKVVIDGEEFSLVSDESETHVLQAAAYVDEILATIRSQAESIDKRKAALLAALQLADKYLQSNSLLTKQKQENDEFFARIEQKLASL